MTTTTREVRDAAAAEVYTIPEAAARMKVSRSHIYNLIWAGELEFVNVALRKNGPTKKRISESAIADYYAARTKRHPRRRLRAN
jgi:excisionase family DNA binding protein